MRPALWLANAQNRRALSVAIRPMMCRARNSCAQWLATGLEPLSQVRLMNQVVKGRYQVNVCCSDRPSRCCIGAGDDRHGVISYSRINVRSSDADGVGATGNDPMKMIGTEREVGGHGSSDRFAGCGRVGAVLGICYGVSGADPVSF